jgi:hypothetical protein
MKEMTINFLISIVLITFFACGKTAKISGNDEQIATDTTIVVLPNEIETSIYDTTAYESISFPQFTGKQEVKILHTGVFQEDEISGNENKQNWFGLFEGKDGFYLAKTQINIKKIPHELSESGWGWEIETVGKKDSCWYLIEAKPYLKERKIVNLKLPINKDSIWMNTYFNPDEIYSFNYSGIDYQFFATGLTVRNELLNYKLYLKANINGKNITTLLAAQPNFDDSMIEILFAADIDGDGILDLIIDNARKYSFLNVTLYLSIPAEKGQIVKPVGFYISFGC